MNIYFGLQTATQQFADVNLWLLMPELIVASAGVLVMLVDAFTKRLDQRWLTGGISLIGLVAAAVSCVWLWTSWTGPTEAFFGMIVLDRLRLSFTLVFLVVSALSVLLSMIWVEWERLPAGEFHALLLFATAGMMLMASGGDLVMIFLGLELLSISTYVMAGFRRTDVRSNEASMKYFILGSFSSAFLLYGTALVYGATAMANGTPGTTNIREIAQRLDTALYPPLLFAGAAMLLIGFGFKVATAPFHVWTPDVYEGAPTPVTAFMAAGPKAAGFASFMRVFLFGFPFVVAAGTAQRLHSAWIAVLVVLAVITMTVGNTAAILQSNVKRMLAYSSIAHAGYVLVGLVAAGAASDLGQRNEAIAAVVFYLLVYSIMTLGAFAVVTILARSGDRRTEIEDYNGIGFDSPWLAFAFSVSLLSLLGVPLTAGFMGKVMVFSAALDQGYVGLVVVAVLNTVVSAYYYLRLIVVMFFRERSGAWNAPLVPASMAIALALTVVGIFYLGIFPGRVIEVFQASPSVISRLLGT
ncbi:NADH-quinone oxidoreductase subunit N [Pyrinomonas methylaliphatogenes]|uniref:NADH-quinone oxidoreductase subunit N n=1 Tax=Pyrinomonas methylaliphatogenes TaxID=454194 RepID=A0A0B6WT94_9BACT|nr:NADH-quinone oxidoreductase subunit N [Pyrinomonas methylaliphatogenes]MBX5479489.1 NADH-quinone oxidoreductase subunit N [Pyrinomonas methylaliphatogenes]CDM64443.1 proton-translocating NADH-quinone oxidoreductase, chain N [Pyrinomonas methylaliphatogenes]